jgi:hypothetical protein
LTALDDHLFERNELSCLFFPGFARVLRARATGQTYGRAGPPPDPTTAATISVSQYPLRTANVPGVFSNASNFSYLFFHIQDRLLRVAQWRSSSSPGFDLELLHVFMVFWK